MRSSAAVFLSFLIAVSVGGCKGKEAQAPPPPPKPKSAPVPKGILIYVSAGSLYRMEEGGMPVLLDAGPAWFPAVKVNESGGGMVAYWQDEADGMSLATIDLVSNSKTIIGKWTSLAGSGRNLNVRNAPCWHPVEDRLFFADGRQIWSVGPDGHNLETLYEHPSGCFSVTVAPDGKKIAFVGVKGGEQNLWVYSLLTHKARALTAITEMEGFVGAPAWSPKSDNIVFVVYKAEESNLWSISAAEGAEAVKLTKEGRVSSPSWTPSGKYIAVSSGMQDPYKWQVALIDSGDGRFLKQLTDSPVGAYSPSIGGTW